MMFPVSRHLVRSGLNILQRRNTTPRSLSRQSSLLASTLCNRTNGQQRVTMGRVSGELTGKMRQSTATVKRENLATILSVTHRKEDWMIEVQWSDKSKDKYPYIWLRDNCQCPECFHSTSKSRRILLQDLDVSLTPVTIKTNEDGDGLTVDWSDGHKGYYPAQWLQDRSFIEKTRNERREKDGFNRSYWNADFIKDLPMADYNALLTKDEALLEFLLKLERLGLVIVQNLPCQRGEIEKLSNRVGFLKRTHYGKTFSVKNKEDANNLAFTSDSLNLHIDLPYLIYKPGVQMLHCISQAPGEGGENHLVDSFHAALQLKDQHPKKFEILTTIPVDFTDVGVEEDGLQFHAQTQEPMIVLDRHGLVNTINLNQMVRDSHFDVPVEKVREWYDAMLTFHKLIYHPDNLITYKLKPGEMAVFDNNRVMHGRRGYTMTEGTRELEGCYWDWDMIKSCRRVLKTKLGTRQ